MGIRQVVGLKCLQQDGACQDSCRLIYAADPVCGEDPAAIRVSASRSGLSPTAGIGVWSWRLPCPAARGPRLCPLIKFWTGPKPGRATCHGCRPELNRPISLSQTVETTFFKQLFKAFSTSFPRNPPHCKAVGKNKSEHRQKSWLLEQIVREQGFDQKLDGNHFPEPLA